jgi:hypothetical protein
MRLFEFQVEDKPSAWPGFIDRLNKAMKATGWNLQRKDDNTFMYSTQGQETDDQYYMVIIENIGDGFFEYALGTMEEGDPHIDEAYKGHLPITDASLSEILEMIREGFGLE